MRPKMQPVDLNQVILAASATCTVDDVKQLLGFSLQQETILQVIKSSRRLDLLPELLPLIRFDRPIVEELEKMLAQAIVDNEQQVIAQIEQCTKQQLSLEKIAFHLGRLAAPSTDVGHYVAYEQYLNGVVSVDNLELFLKIDISECDLNHLRGDIAEYSATKILSHLLEIDADRYNCIASAYHHFSKGVIKLIFEKYPDRQVLLDKLNRLTIQCLCVNWIDPNELIEPTQWLLAQGFLVLSDADWQKIRGINPTFYRELQSDV